MALSTRHSLPQAQLNALHAVVQAAMDRSAATLSEMSGVSIAISATAIDIVPLAEVPTAVGRPEDPAVGVYVGMEGDGSGYLLLLLDELMAGDLAALMLGEEPGSVAVEDELAASALAEAGNVACSAFMNGLGEATGLTLMAMPPVVVGDMRGAIMDVAIADIAQHGDEALLIKTQLAPADVIAADSTLVNARLLAIPTPDTLGAIMGGLKKAA
ncbi:MAG TPA: chemotaxis protein CheX [Chloroflexota bacterium]|nr:chemotaxis protein CheX [Chloroflexota bacterium]